MSDYPLPSFLAPRVDEYENEQYAYDQYEYDQQGTFERELRDTSGLLRASVITVAVAVGGIVLAVSLGHPVRVLADATASLSDNKSSPGIRSAADTPPVQSSADARSSAPAPGGTLTREDMAALAELTNQARTDNNEATAGALLEQFQAWAARQDAQVQERTLAEEPAQPAEAAPVQIARDDPAPEETVQRHRTSMSLQNAHAEMTRVQKPDVQKPRAKIQRKLAARRQAAPIQDARAQVLPAPNAQQPQQPSFMQSFGWNQ